MAKNQNWVIIKDVESGDYYTGIMDRSFRWDNDNSRFVSYHGREVKKIFDAGMISDKNMDIVWDAFRKGQLEGKNFNKDYLELIVSGSNIAGYMEALEKIVIDSDMELTEFLTSLYDEWQKIDSSLTFNEMVEEKLLEKFGLEQTVNTDKTLTIASDSKKSQTKILQEILNLAKTELEFDEGSFEPLEYNVGYTMPDGNYHLFIYVDEIDDELVYVVEPNKLIDGGHEPMGDTYIATYGNFGDLMVGCMWAMEEFEFDKKLEKESWKKQNISSKIEMAKQSFAEKREEIKENRNGGFSR